MSKDSLIERSLPVAAAVMILLCGRAACAQTQKTDAGDAGKETGAKEAFLKGVEDFKGENYADALAEFKESYGLVPKPKVLLNVAMCEKALLFYDDSIESFKKYLVEDKNASDEKRKEVEGHIKEMQERGAKVTIATDPSPLEVLIDGKKKIVTPMGGPMLIGPGKHVLEAGKEGYKAVKMELLLAQSEEKQVALKLEKIEVIPKSPSVEEKPKGGMEEKPKPALSGASAEKPKTVDQDKIVKKEEGGKKNKGKKKLGKAPFGVMAGLTAALLGSAVVTGALALSAHKDFEKQYWEDRDEWKRLKDKSDSLAIATDVLIGVGSAAALAAIVMGVFTDWKGGKEKREGDVKASLAVDMGPEGAGFLVRGDF